MKKIVWSKKQKNNLIHDFNIEFHKIFYNINKWIQTCENVEQLENIYNFIELKIDHINNKLKKYWVAPWLSKSLNKKLQDNLQAYLDNLQAEYECVQAEFKMLEEQLIKESKIIKVKGFGSMFYEEED